MLPGFLKSRIFSHFERQQKKATFFLKCFEIGNKATFEQQRMLPKKRLNLKVYKAKQQSNILSIYKIKIGRLGKLGIAYAYLIRLIFAQ